MRLVFGKKGPRDARGGSSLLDLIDRELGGGGRGWEVGGCGCVFERLRCHVEFVESSQPVREVMAGHCWTPVDGQKQE